MGEATQRDVHGQRELAWREVRASQLSGTSTRCEEELPASLEDKGRGQKGGEGKWVAALQAVFTAAGP